MKNILRYFVQGLLVLVPVTITMLVFYKAFSWVRELFSGIHEIVHPAVDPFIYLSIVVAFVLLVGIFASNVFARFFIDEAGKVLEKSPLLERYSHL